MFLDQELISIPCKPTAAPTRECMDYYNYTTNDGEDLINDILSNIDLYTENDMMNSSMASYVGNDLHGKEIRCNESDIDICFIGCYASGNCIKSVVQPSNITLRELRIVYYSNACRI